MSANILSFIREETYKFKVYNRIFAEHSAIISTTETGNSYADVVTSGVTYHYRKSNEDVYTGSVHYMPEGDYSYQIHTGATHSTDSQQVDVIQIDFTPNSSHADTLYIKSGKDDGMAVKIYILDAVGSLLNAEQFFYLLGVRRSNRLYALPSYQKFIDAFIKYVLPAGAERKVTNMAPSVQGVVPAA